MRDRPSRISPEIDQLAIEAIAPGPPAVLVDQPARIHSKCDILLAQLVQFDDDSLHQRRQRDGILHAGLRIADAEFDGVEKGMEPNIPPNLFRIVDAIGGDEKF